MVGSLWVEGGGLGVGGGLYLRGDSFARKSRRLGSRSRNGSPSLVDLLLHGHQPMVGGIAVNRKVNEGFRSKISRSYILLNPIRSSFPYAKKLSYILLNIDIGIVHTDSLDDMSKQKSHGLFISALLNA